MAAAAASSRQLAAAASSRELPVAASSRDLAAAASSRERKKGRMRERLNRAKKVFGDLINYSQKYKTSGHCLVVQ